MALIPRCLECFQNVSFVSLKDREACYLLSTSLFGITALFSPCALAPGRVPAGTVGGRRRVAWLQRQSVAGLVQGLAKQVLPWPSLPLSCQRIMSCQAGEGWEEKISGRQRERERGRS
eukprot:g24461.t1